MRNVIDISCRLVQFDDDVVVELTLADLVYCLTREEAKDLFQKIGTTIMKHDMAVLQKPKSLP